MSLPNNPPDPGRALEIAAAAAREAGALLREGYDRPKTVHFKGEIDLVTEYDLASEKLLLARIASAFPDHEILSEEAGEIGPPSASRWYIDPLDGTTNFAHGFPAFCVSIALETLTEKGPALTVAVVYDPLRDELYTAATGGGAWLNGRRLSVSGLSDLGMALVATGFPYNIRRNPGRIFDRFLAMQMISRGVRRAGSAALDLAWTAAGRLDGFWEERLHPWDMAAGALLVSEAGGRVTDFSDRPFDPAMKEVLATNGRLHYNMRQILAPDQPGPPGQAVLPGEVR